MLNFFLNFKLNMRISVMPSGVQGNPENRLKLETGSIFSILPVYPAPQPETDFFPVKPQPEKTRILFFQITRILSKPEPLFPVSPKPLKNRYLILPKSPKPEKTRILFFRVNLNR